MELIKVLLIEDDKDWLKGLTTFLKREKDIVIAGYASSGNESVDMVFNQEVDIVLMDIMMNNEPEGIWATAQISQMSLAKVIMLTSIENQDMIAESFAAGAVDYVFKNNFHAIPDAIRAVHRNYVPIRPEVTTKLREEINRLKKVEREFKASIVKRVLTPTEVNILIYVDQGYTQAQMAEKSYVSIHTIKVHIANILKKLGEESSKKAAQHAKDLGII